MQATGGVMPPTYAERHAVGLIGSGPTGGVMGAAFVARRSGARDFVTVDMGGTSYDVCLVRDAQPQVSVDWNWRNRYYIGLPMVDVHAVGAGGGSIARVRQGALLVGPESAGPSPVPHVTDVVAFGPPSPTLTAFSATCPSTGLPPAGCDSIPRRPGRPLATTWPPCSVWTWPRRPGPLNGSSMPTWPTPCVGWSPLTERILARWS